MERDYDKHLPILAWVHIVYGAMSVITGVAVLFVYSWLGTEVGDPESARIVWLVGVGVCLFLFLVGLPGIIAGWGLLKRRRWARGLAIVLGILSLLSVPIGTALGIYTLWLLWGDEAVDAFD